MAAGDLFKTTTTSSAPLNGAVLDEGTAIGEHQAASVSDFLTVQSFANFSATTGAITAAWKALQGLDKSFSGTWVPYVFAGIFLLVSVVSSWEGMKTDGRLKWGTVLSAVFIAIINALVLASAVVGVETATEAAAANGS
jgi:hypothetical protein